MQARDAISRGWGNKGYANLYVGQESEGRCRTGAVINLRTTHPNSNTPFEWKLMQREEAGINHAFILMTYIPSAGSSLS
jgi:hypothetical protein